LTAIQSLDEIARHLEGLYLSHPVRVGIDGVDGAGKTTLADALGKMVAQRTNRPVIRASIDGFHRPRAERYARGRLSAQGYYLDSFDYPSLRACLLDPLGPGGDRRVRTVIFDYRVDRSSPETENGLPTWITVGEESLLIFDGVFLMRPELAGCWDVTLLIDVKWEVALDRALQRDLKSTGSDQSNRLELELRQRYLQRYYPAQVHYMTICSPRERANYVLENNGYLTLD
jgi:uridine kinase